MAHNCIRSLIGILIFIFCLPIAEARGPRARRTSSPEEQVQACIENKQGMLIVLRGQLNEARNPLVENIQANDWNKYCACYAPKARAIEEARPRGNLPNDVFQKMTADLATASIACAKASIPEGKPAVVEYPPVGRNPRFDASVKYCTEHPSGYLTNLKVHLEVRKSPRASGVAKMDAKKYCECYVRSLRQRLGDEDALKELTTLSPPADKDLMRFSKAKDEVYDYCAAEQIPFQ